PTRATCVGLLMFLASLPAPAQVREVWSRIHSSGGNSGARAMAIDPQGNVYVTGFSNDLDNNSSDFVTVKYLADGTRAWLRTYDGSGHGYDFPSAIAVSSAGEVWVTGASDG